jgi:hypothetical protein
VPALSTPAIKLAVTLPLTSTPSPYDGIRMIDCNDPGFDARVDLILKSSVPAIRALKPFLVVISNQSRRTIVAYGVNFVVAGAQSVAAQFKYPAAVYRTQTAVLPRGREILPGEERVVGPYFEIDPAYMFKEEWLRTFAKWQTDTPFKGATGLRVDLDAVIFDDGEVVGPDASGLEQEFASYFKATQEFFGRISDSLRSGSSVSGAFGVVDATRNTPPKDFAVVGVYRILAADDANILRKTFDDQAIRKLFEQLRAPTSFVVHRQLTR